MADRDFFKAFSSRSQRTPASTPANNMSVTPQRRPREVQDVDGTEEEDDISVDENGSIRSLSSKRLRPDTDGEGFREASTTPGPSIGASADDDLYGASPRPNHNAAGASPNSDPISDDPVLPDSFRRSPRRSQTRVSYGEAPRSHQPGSIVRVRLTQFVTYTKAEFHPGPNLNMIIGPNGTGKSTLVCAICLGLGWKPDHLGRAKEIGEFVKHGEKVAYIEIELARDPNRHAKNPVVLTKITKEGNKTEFSLDGQKISKKHLLELMNSFCIQVDNLCQFLPQDRVVEFAAQTPVALLASTQKAAAPEHMTQWHEELKSLRKRQKEKQVEQANLADYLKKKEDRQRGQQADVDRLRERADLQQKYDALQKLRPYNEYAELRKSHAEAKGRQKAAAAALKELEEQALPSQEAIEQQAQYAATMKAHLTSLQNQLPSSHARLKKGLADHQELVCKIEDKKGEFKIEKENNQNLKIDLKKLSDRLKQVEESLNHPPEQMDFAEVNRQITDMIRLQRDIDDKKQIKQNEYESATEQHKQRRELLERLVIQQAKSQTQIGQREQKVNRLSSHTVKAWEWLQKNRSVFEGEVYGPPALECTVRDPGHAAAVETMLNKGDKLAFTVTTKADFTKLSDHLYGTMRLKDIYIRQSSKPLNSFTPSISRDQLQDFGLEAFLIDLVDGPEPILAMLCDSRNIHQTGFTSKDLTEVQHNRLQNSRMSSWATSKESCTVTRRAEYGPDGVSVRTNALKPAFLFTDAPASNHDDGETNRKKSEYMEEMRELEETRKEVQNKMTELGQEHSKITADIEAAKDKKRRNQQAQTTFDGLSTKKETLLNKMNESRAKLARAGATRQEIYDEIDRLTLEKAVLASKLPLSVEAFRRAHVSIFEAELMEIEARSEHQQLEMRHADATRAIREHEAAVEQHRATVQELRQRGVDLQTEIQEIGELSPFEAELQEQVQQLTTADYETELEAVQARLQMNTGSANQKLLKEYEERAQQIINDRARLAEIETSLESLGNEILEIRQQWEPELDALVAKISDAYAENMGQIHCVGEVCVHKDEDFDQWAIQIKVKFRENEQLAILDNHRQSGGERAVSTIFYLMSLQSLARAPFRVVDEINQGMDPRNERMVHSRMVEIACGANSASQYFLITPKLLSGLRYHSSMKVHCIASGEHMPQDHGRLDFNMLAQKALRVKGFA